MKVAAFLFIWSLEIGVLREFREGEANGGFSPFSEDKAFGFEIQGRIMVPQEVSANSGIEI